MFQHQTIQALVNMFHKLYSSSPFSGILVNCVKLTSTLTPCSPQLLKFVLDDDDKGHHTLKINPSEVGTHTISLVYGKVCKSGYL